MGKFKELVHMLPEDKEVMEELTNIIDEAMTHMDKDTYKHTIEKIEKLAYRISKDDAIKIVRDMSPTGQQWSYETVKDFIAQKGIEHDCVSWYLVMNMVYNDYYNTAKLFGLHNDAEFYFSLAKDFIEDPDASPLKVQKYFMD